MPCKSVLCTILTLLGVFLSNLALAVPTNPAPETSPTNATLTDFVQPYCLNETTQTGAGVTNSNDCRKALGIMLGDPGGRIIYQFSKNVETPPGSAKYHFRKLPVAWRYKQCTIMLSSQDDVGSGFFTTMDVARMVPGIIKDCVERGDKYGGVAPIGADTHFFVLVAQLQLPALQLVSGEGLNHSLLENSTLERSVGGDLGSGSFGALSDS